MKESNPLDGYFLVWGCHGCPSLHIVDHLASQAIMCRPHACFFPSQSNSTSMPVITARIQKAWIMGKRDGGHKAEIEGGFKCIDNKDSVFFDLGFCLLWTYK